MQLVLSLDQSYGSIGSIQINWRVLYNFYSVATTCSVMQLIDLIYKTIDSSLETRFKDLSDDSDHGDQL
ncbi:unnamed protein product [Ambrosiozyma monospora]|uniref:Unnamed protein product n=1 Tax=Ambrosiozyma monospora TaxID=43982 RepID=A0A9W6YUM6_AMBMO|nr:unnamed protein product [Ambrosiozyma monospora]